MGDVCEVETRIQSAIETLIPHYSSNIMHYADSDIIHVSALGTSIIILNSYEAATDLLDQRSSTYSSR